MQHLVKSVLMVFLATGLTPGPTAHEERRSTPPVTQSSPSLPATESPVNAAGNVPLATEALWQGQPIPQTRTPGRGAIASAVPHPRTRRVSPPPCTDLGTRASVGRSESAAASVPS
jgi:hypothetical protein